MKKIGIILAVLTVSFSTFSELTKETKKDVVYIKEEIKPSIGLSQTKEFGESVEEELDIDEKASYKHYQTGVASYYKHGSKTASGERFNKNGMTAAHRTLPFGTKVKVTNLNNGKSVVVRINDRGPFIKGRVIDLSYAAFSKIANVSSGITRVKLEIQK